MGAAEMAVTPGAAERAMGAEDAGRSACGNLLT